MCLSVHFLVICVFACSALFPDKVQHPGLANYCVGTFTVNASLISALFAFAMLAAVCSVVLALLALFYHWKNSKSLSGQQNQVASQDNKKDKAVIKTVLVQSLSPVLLMSPSILMMLIKSSQKIDDNSAILTYVSIFCLSLFLLNPLVDAVSAMCLLPSYRNAILAMVRKSAQQGHSTQSNAVGQAVSSRQQVSRSRIAWQS